MSKFDYKRYLASREWALLKEKLRERSFGYCERCATRPYQETHHVTYANVGNEPLEDLLAVCSDCHSFLSAKSDDDPAAETVLVVVAVRGSEIDVTQGRIITALYPSEITHVLHKGSDGKEYFRGPLPVWMTDRGHSTFELKPRRDLADLTAGIAAGLMA